MAETVALHANRWHKTRDWLQSIDWSRVVRRKGPALALAGGLALSGCTVNGRSTPSAESSSAGAENTISGLTNSNTAGTSATASIPNTCPEDPKNATAADADPKNPQLIFSWLCGGANTVFVYHGPKDTPADRQVVGTYFGVKSEPGKNVAPVTCYFDNGRPVPSHPERGELPRPTDIETHWFKLQAGAWATETYSYNGQILEQEKAVPECQPSDLPSD